MTDLYSEISSGDKCFIIAEAGVNHNGSLEMAKGLIDAAMEAGADAVKFQTFKAKDIVIETAEKAKYQKETTDPYQSQLDMLKQLELTDEDFRELASYAKKKGIIFISTPFDRRSADLLGDIGIPVFKIPSGEVINIPLLKHIARKGKPIIMSTGMAGMEEIDMAVETIKDEGNDAIILLHCVTSYPAKVEEMNLKAMETLKQKFDLPVGLSDHSLGVHVALAAVALGAVVIEKHFTLNRTLPGPDHRTSLEPSELEDMVEKIREIEKALGTGEKVLTEGEEEIKKVARRSIVAAADIPEGAVLDEAMLAVKRPQGGLEPRYFDDLIGKVVLVNIKKDAQVKKEMIKW